MSQPSSTDPLVPSLAAAAHRSPGRPRDARADTAILDATLELAGSVGLAGLTMDAVAALAGVSKATIYRRWSSKESLVLDAWMACFTDESVPDTGSVKGDLVAMTRMTRDAVSTGTYSRVLPQMVAAARVNEELAAVYQQFVANRRRRTQTVLERAINRGELPAGLDLELVQDMLVGPLFYRALITGTPSPDEITAQIVDIVVSGVVAIAARTDPTPPSG